MTQGSDEKNKLFSLCSHFAFDDDLMSSLECFSPSLSVCPVLSSFPCTALRKSCKCMRVSCCVCILCVVHWNHWIPREETQDERRENKNLSGNSCLTRKQLRSLLLLHRLFLSQLHPLHLSLSLFLCFVRRRLLFLILHDSWGRSMRLSDLTTAMFLLHSFNNNMMMVFILHFSVMKISWSPQDCVNSSSSSLLSRLSFSEKRKRQSRVWNYKPPEATVVQITRHHSIPFIIILFINFICDNNLTTRFYSFLERHLLHDHEIICTEERLEIMRPNRFDEWTLSDEVCVKWKHSFVDSWYFINKRHDISLSDQARSHRQRRRCTNLFTRLTWKERQRRWKRKDKRKFFVHRQDQQKKNEDESILQWDRVNGEWFDSSSSVKQETLKEFLSDSSKRETKTRGKILLTSSLQLYHVFDSLSSHVLCLIFWSKKCLFLREITACLLFRPDTLLFFIVFEEFQIDSFFVERDSGLWFSCSRLWCLVLSFLVMECLDCSSQLQETSHILWDPPFLSRWSSDSSIIPNYVERPHE